MELGKTLYVKDRAGLAKIRRHLDEEFVIAPDILSALQKDEVVNFARLPESYRRIRIGWIESARRRPETFQTRLNYLIKMTSKNKMYAMVK